MEKAKIRIALAGNPNSGKTTLFNTLTGSNQYVGNWPGVTVEKKEGKLKKHPDVVITDLPGIYSLSPYTLEEVIARKYLVSERPDVILDIVDGTNLERNLYLTTQLIELGIPVVIAVNMMDSVKKSKNKIDFDNISKQLGCRVVGISALKNTGIDEAVKAALEAAGGALPHSLEFDESIEKALADIEQTAGDKIPEAQKRFYSVKLFERDDKILEELQLNEKIREHIETDIKICEKDFDDDAESIITNERYTKIAELIKKCYTKNPKHTGGTVSDKIDRVVTNRFLALPIFVVVMFLVYFLSVSSMGLGTAVTDWVNDGVFGDGWHLLGIGSGAYEEVAEEFNRADEITSAFEAEAEKQGAIDTQASTDDEIVFIPEKAETIKITVQIHDDKGGIIEEVPVDYAGYLEAAKITEPDPAEYGVWVPGIPPLVESLLIKAHSPEWLNGLILNGIIGGVGAVLGFVPQMLVLFLLLALLEGCGYMARIAFVLDRIFRRFGLSGKSFIPMLIGVGCGVPGIMASRTIENERDRRMTIMTTTFVPCSAKLPIIALIAGAMFGKAWWVAPVAYFIGIAAIIVSGIILKKTKSFAGEPAPFVMELPAYHMPTAKNIFQSMWERASSFIRKAGTVILLSSILVWFLSSFGFKDGFRFIGEDLDSSLLAKIGNGIAWIFAPLGFGQWQSAVATFTGLIAKENVVSTFGVLFHNAGVAENGWQIWTSLSELFGGSALAAFSFLVFNLLCAPCFAAIGAIKREMNSAKWTAFAILYQTAFAYTISLIIYQFGLLFTGRVQVVGIIFAAALLLFMLFMLFKPYKEATKLEKKLKV